MATQGLVGVCAQDRTVESKIVAGANGSRALALATWGTSDQQQTESAARKEDLDGLYQDAVRLADPQMSPRSEDQRSEQVEIVHLD